MPFSKIFKQAYAILRTHKFLWVLGLLLVWGNLLNLVSYLFDDKNQSAQNARLLEHLKNHTTGDVIGLIAIFLVMLILLVLYFRSKAAIIIVVKSMLEKQPTGLGKSFKSSKLFYIRIFGLWFVTIFLLILVAALLGGPVAYLASIHYSSRALTLGVFALIIFLPISFVVNSINNLGPMFIVEHDMKIGEAISISFDMTRKHWPTVLAFSIALWFLTLIASIILVSTIGLGVAILSPIFYNMGTFGVLNIVLAIAVTLVFILILGMFACYQQIAWVLLFDELVRPVKLEEEEPVPMPEVVS